MGGGMEIILNCDLVVASTRSVFALPEAARGVIASQGGIARLARICGHQRAAEMLLLCEPIPAEQAYHSFHFINRLVPMAPPSKSATSAPTPAASSSSEAQPLSWEEGERTILATALVLARTMASHSPDAIQLTKAALLAARGSTPSIHPDASNQNRDGDGNGKETTEEALSSRMDDFREGDVNLLAVQLYRSRRSRALFAGENLQEGLRAFQEKRAPVWSDVPLDATSTPPGWASSSDKRRSKL